MDCNFKCLTECPSPGKCLYDDPQMGDWYKAEYPEFFWWRLDNLPEKKRPKLVTPTSMEKFYKEPTGNVYRCPRCLSTNIHIGAIWIICRACRYNEPLIDFPENRKYLTDRYNL